MTKILTPELLMSFNPCSPYDEKMVRELLGDGLPIAGVLDLNIPPEDILWAVLRTEFFTDRDLRLIACDFAAEVLPIYEKHYPGDSRPAKAIAVARKYANGEATGDELRAAWDAAWAAAGDAWDAGNAWAGPGPPVPAPGRSGPPGPAGPTPGLNNWPSCVDILKPRRSKALKAELNKEEGK